MKEGSDRGLTHPPSLPRRRAALDRHVGTHAPEGPDPSGPSALQRARHGKKLLTFDMPQA